MRTLTLVRHAKSSWSDPALDDFQRPLNERGRRDAPLMAERFANSLSGPVSLVSSPAVRAAATAAAFAQALQLKPSDIHFEQAIYEASAARLLDIIRQLDDSKTSIVLFGHNPGFSDLCHLLARCDFVEMPTCAITRLDFDVDQWRQIEPGSGRLMAFSFPKERQ